MPASPRTGNLLANTFSGFDGTSILNGGDGSDTAVFTGQFATVHVHRKRGRQRHAGRYEGGSPDGTDDLQISSCSGSATGSS